MNDIKINKFLLDSGERYCIVMNKSTGLPLYYPNLYLTTEIRNRGYAIATIESRAIIISLLYRFLEKEKINIDLYILSGKFFQRADIEKLVAFLSRTSDSKNGMYTKSVFVSKKTLCNRLDNIIHYLSWLTNELSQHDFTKHEATFLKAIKYIEERKPRYRNHKRGQSNEDAALSDNVVDLIMERIDLHSHHNPFEKYVRERNRIMILMLFELGIRCGELLNIKIGDIDFQKQRLHIIRRADEKSDPRLIQPLVKTLDRVLPISGELISELTHYIIYDRKIFTRGKTDFLFISYKSGPTQGNPITISGYHKIISKIRNSNPLLKDLTGHRFRHTWNYNFSRFLDSLPQKIGESEQEEMREQLMGWKQGSGTAAIYNKRFIKEKSDKASIELQSSLLRKNARKLDDE